MFAVGIGYWFRNTECDVSAFLLINFDSPFTEPAFKDLGVVLEIRTLGEDQCGERGCRYHLQMWVGLGCRQCILCAG